MKKHLNTAIVAQPAEKIAEMAGLDIPENTEFIIVPKMDGDRKICFQVKNYQ